MRRWRDLGERRPCWQTTALALAVAATFVVGNASYLLIPHYEINADSAGGCLGALEIAKGGHSFLGSGRLGMQLRPLADQLQIVLFRLFGASTYTAYLPYELMTLLTVMLAFFFLRRHQGTGAALIGLACFVFPGTMQTLYFTPLPVAECLTVGFAVLFLATAPRLSPLLRGAIVLAVLGYASLNIYLPVISFFISIPLYLLSRPPTVPAAAPEQPLASGSQRRKSAGKGHRRQGRNAPRSSLAASSLAADGVSILRAMRVVAIAIAGLVVLLWGVQFLELWPEVTVLGFRITVHASTKLLVGVVPLVALLLAATREKQIVDFVRVHRVVAIAALLLVGVAVGVAVHAKADKLRLMLTGEADYHFRHATIAQLTHNLRILHDIVTEFIAQGGAQRPLRVIAPLAIGFFYLVNALQLVLLVCSRAFRTHCRQSLMFWLYYVSLLIFLVHGNLVSAAEVRYLPMLPVTFWVVAWRLYQFVAPRCRARASARWAARLAFASVLLTSFSSAFAVSTQARQAGKDVKDLVAYLDLKGITEGYGDYWYGYNLIFLTHERIVIHPLYSQFSKKYRGPVSGRGRIAIVLSTSLNNNVRKSLWEFFARDVVPLYGVRYVIRERQAIGEAQVMIAEPG